MSIAAASQWATAVSDVTSEDVFIRGYPLQSLLGSLPFAGVTFLIVLRRLPSPSETRMMDAILCSILDYALHKSGTIAARAVASVNPQMIPSLAAGVLAAGEFAVSPESAGRFVTQTFSAWKASNEPMEAFAGSQAAEMSRQKRRAPGFGHPVFRHLDPRAERLKSIATETGVWGEVNEWYACLHRAVQAATRKPDLVLNDVGMLAGIMTQMGFTPDEMAGLAVLSTFPGLVAHVSEELQSGVRNRIIPDSLVDYARVRRDLSADMVAAGWS